MKTLANQTLLYDDGCPLCSVYTSGFIKTGMLDARGRKPYAQLTDDEMIYVDVQRAANEIALIDRQNKTVIYGIDSLLKVIGNSFPLAATVGNFKPLHYLLAKLYSFISYNRKVIIPNKKNDTALQCIPDFKYDYRIAYIVFATLVTAIVLFNYSILIETRPHGNFGRELALATGQIIFQGLFLLNRDKETTLNYFGNLITVSLMGSLLLVPMLLLSHFFAIHQLLILGWFGLTAAIMFAEHYRRIIILRSPHYLCYTWVTYRLIALALILNL
jgi:hypothetical protein